MRVSESAYHAYRGGKTYVMSAAKAERAKQVREVFERHRRRYGSRRIASELKAQHIRIGRFAVRTMMRRQNLLAMAPRRFVPRTTDLRHTGQASPNLLRDEANAPQKPREVIVGDISYLPIRSGRWSYLASWQDKYSKRIVGWAVEDRMTDDLVTKALGKAISSGSISCGTIVYTGRGSQYVSNSFRALLQTNKCRQSMSRRANCYDDAQAESFFSRYKAELLEDGMFESVEQARSETFSYIEGYYNRVRRHSSLRYKTPEEFERERHINNPTKEASSERVVSRKT